MLRDVTEPVAAILVVLDHPGSFRLQGVGHTVQPREVDDCVDVLGIILDRLFEVRDESLHRHIVHVHAYELCVRRRRENEDEGESESEYQKTKRAHLQSSSRVTAD